MLLCCSHVFAKAHHPSSLHSYCGAAGGKHKCVRFMLRVPWWQQQKVGTMRLRVPTAHNTSDQLHAARRMGTNCGRLGNTLLRGSRYALCACCMLCWSRHADPNGPPQTLVLWLRHTHHSRSAKPVRADKLMCIALTAAFNPCAQHQTQTRYQQTIRMSITQPLQHEDTHV